MTHSESAARPGCAATDIPTGRLVRAGRLSRLVATRVPLRFALGLAAAVGSLLLLASAASATERIGLHLSYPFDADPGSLGSAQGVAVSEKEGGDIYVMDSNSGMRVNQFTPAGAFVRAFGWGIVPGAASGTGNITSGSNTITQFSTTSGSFSSGGAGGKIVTGPGIPADTRVKEIKSSELVLSNAAILSTSAATVTSAAGPGNTPTNEQQAVTVRATAGQFTLSFISPNPGSTTETTASIPYNASAGAVESALAGLANVGAGNVTVSGGPGSETGGNPYLIEFKSRFADTNVRKLAAAGVGLSGGSPSSAVTVSTAVEGGGVVETCTTVCGRPSAEENAVQSGSGFGGSRPGQFNGSQEIAVDNDPASESYGDVYVVDQRDFRVEKYGPEGEFLLMFGGEIDKGPHHPGDVCTPEYIAEGDTCGIGVGGTGPAHFYESTVHPPEGSAWQSWNTGPNAIAVGPDGTVYVGDYRRVQEFEPNGTYKSSVAMPNAQFIGSLAVDSESNVYANNTSIDETQLVLPTAGSYTLTFEGHTTEAIPSSAQDYYGHHPIAEALEQLSTIGTGNVKVETTGGQVRVSFRGSLGERNVPQMEASGATVSTLVEGAGYELVKLGPSSEVLHNYDAGGEPRDVALDSEGNVFVSEFKEIGAPSPPSGDHQPFFVNAGFIVYSPAGGVIAEISSEQVQSKENESEGSYKLVNGNPSGITVGDGAGSLYATSLLPEEAHIAVIPLPAPGPPVVSKERATDVQTKTATIRALVNPREFNTSYHFEYVDEAHFESEGFASTATQTTGDVPLGLIERNYPAQASISGLDLETKYRFRVVAESSYEGGSTVFGPAESFETLPAVSVRGLTTMTVGPERLQIQAELNPNGSAGEYRIIIGKTTGYGEGTAEGVLPISNEFETVTAEFTHLTPNTLYHYQLESENGYTEGGVLKTPDQVVTTELSAAEEFSAEDCANGSHHGEPNSTLREQNNSLALADCRAYEQVTEPTKEGGEAFAAWSLAPSGERVLYLSGGAFAGLEANEFTGLYLAQRTEGGWTTMPVIKRVGPPGTEPSMTPVEDAFSPELDRWLYMESPAVDHLQQFFESTNGYLSEGFANGNFIAQASPRYELLEGEARPYYETLAMDPHYRSDDMSHVFFVTNARLLPGAEDPRPDGYWHGGLVPQSDRIYEFSDIGGANPSMQLVAEVPLDMSTFVPGFSSNLCSLNLDTSGARDNEYARSTSTDGATIVYSGPVVNEPAADHCGPGTPNPIALFTHYEGEGVSLGQSVSHQLNAVRPAQCSGSSPCATGVVSTPVFAGMSEDGHRAVFATSQPLIDSDTDTSADVYVADLEHGEVTNLTQATVGEANPDHPTPGSGAGVEGGVRMSADGSHIAFVATGVLTTSPNSAGESAAAGADNFYVYDVSTGVTKFVTRLCSPSTVGEGEKCGSGVPSHLALTRDGAFMVFSSSGQLTADDTDHQSDVFRYDYQTGTLLRVSFGRRGNDANGNDSRYPNEVLVGSGGIGDANRLAEDVNRTMSADGSIVIFSTAAPLVSHDTNEAFDLYEWEEQGHGTCTEAGGCISLVSDGVDPRGVGGETGVISASGRDITFETQRGQTPGDRDGVGDIYDARVDGGFRYAPPPASCGSPEACRPAPTAAPGVPNFTSEVNVSGGNGATKVECAQGRHRVKKHGQVRCVPNSRRGHHHHHHHKKHKRANRKRGGGR